MPLAIKFNASPPSATYMGQWTRITLVQVMACRLFGTKPLPELMVNHWQRGPWEQTSVKLELKFKTFHSRNCNWKCCLWNGGHFVQGEMSLQLTFYGVSVSITIKLPPVLQLENCPCCHSSIYIYWVNILKVFFQVSNNGTERDIYKKVFTRCHEI